MKKFYLVAAIFGTIIPYCFFFKYIQLHGGNLPDFITALFINGAAGGFSVDLFVSSFVFWVFMFKRWKMQDAPKPWLFIVLNLGIGLSCALPLYLYFIEPSQKINHA
jgi:Terpene cyclase DEP1